MAEEQISIDGVRASRDGNQYHEAWAARIALELLPPDSTLTAIAIEGFSTDEPTELSDGAHQIADLVRYRGGRNSLTAERVETVQFKYSIASASTPMRASELAKTIRKFAIAERDLQKNSPVASARECFFEVVTNRPIDPDTLAAMAVLRAGGTADEPEGKIAIQVDQLRAAIGFEDDELVSFAKRLVLTGAGGSLDEIEHSNFRKIASWSGATDSYSRARLANLRNLVNGRAGSGGQRDNLIDRIDVLGALGVGHEDDLYPVRAAFMQIETPIARTILVDLACLVFAEQKPLLVHAAGGVGKTVLMQALASKLADDHCVVLFDGFGAGSWRDPSDARHLPHKTLPNLANLLAANGLCDILLTADHIEDSLRAFRERLMAAVSALRAFRPGAYVILLLDAIDHCGIRAKAMNSQSFARSLLESLSVKPIPGVQVVASCRSHRRDNAQGEAQCREYEIPVFTREETEQLVISRHPSASSTDVTVLHLRSGGNPRILDNLLRHGPPFDPAIPGGDADTLEALLSEQISTAQTQAIQRGATQLEADGLLTGMALLPPPVPVGELAAALGLSESDIESFVADLSPLIEQTSTGLIFRDEPTETIIRDTFGKNDTARIGLETRLQSRQKTSIYSARALPGILVEVGEIDKLVQLAFESLDQTELSRVARRGIRLARLNAAAISCASDDRVDDLTKIALEGARISSATERSDAYLRAHPHLVALSGDEEAIRRFREDRRGWAGSRHASLALLEAFSDNAHRAALESDRALTWYNWWIRERDEGRSKDRLDTETLLANALFVQLLLGKAVRVERFLAGEKHAYTFGLASAMLELVDAHSRVGPGGDLAVKLAEVLQRCRTKSPPVLAAITQQICLPTDAKRQLICRLAAIEPDPRKSSFREDYTRLDAYADALIYAAGQAVNLGLIAEGQAIIGHAQAQAPSAYELSSLGGLRPSVVQHMKVAVLSAAARRRPTNVTDILPRDMRDVVPASIRRRGPAAFEKQLLRLIAVSQSNRRQRPRASIKVNVAGDWEQLLKHRLTPLSCFVDLLSELLKAREPTVALTKVIAAASTAIETAQDYPFRDQTSFLKRLLSALLLWAVSCHAHLSRDSAERLAEFLEGIDLPDVEGWFQAIALLARQPAAEAVALRLAKRARKAIAADTSIAQQIQNHGKLARLLLPISLDEVQHHFHRGLELADAVGSDDQERIGEIITFAAQYRGEPLPEKTVHGFARFCELNFPENDEHLDWRAFARALAAIGGAPALAVLARLADRKKVELGWTLPPMLKALVECDYLKPIYAAGLIGLDEFQSTSDWLPPDMAEVILSRLPSEYREPFAEHLIIELDRTNAAYVGAEELTRYATIFASPLAPQSRSRARIAELDAALHQKSREEAKPSADRDIAVPQTIRDAMTITGAALHAAIAETAAGYEGHAPAAGFILCGYVRGILDPKPRSAFLKAIVADEELSLSDKLYPIEEAQKHWHDQSPAFNAQIEEAAIDVALRNLDELVQTRANWRWPLWRIALIVGNRQKQLVTKVIAALAGQNLEITSDFWMSCALVLSKLASPPAIAAALERYVSLITESFPHDIGDGPWSTQFQVGLDQDAIVADLIWLRLGAPEAVNRWRAAHALRRLVDFDGKQILKRLMEGIQRTDAGAFQDRSLPFFHLNARMWLLIAVARIAKADPARIVPFQSGLEAVAASDRFPHVLCRHFAIEALCAMTDTGVVENPAKYRLWLDTLNRPSLPRGEFAASRPDFYSQRPKDLPQPEPPFWFAHDFDKYQVDPLGSVFGLPKWEVESAAIDWIRHYDLKIERMWDCQRPRWSSEDRTWGFAGFSETDLYGGQLAWHAVLLAAGEFARERPVRGKRGENDPWRSWLDSLALSRADGLWLADGTDPFPVEDRLPIIDDAGGGKKRAYVPRHPLDLLPLAGFDGTLALPTEFIVSGNWDSANESNINVSSQIVSTSGARLMAHAVYCDDPHFAYLPVEQTDDDEIDELQVGRVERTIHWLSVDRQAEAKLDSHDPYGFNTALRRLRPSQPTIKKLGLSRADAFGRIWADSVGKTVFRAEAWGARQGRYHRRTERGGTRLSVSSEQLAGMLAEEKSALLLLIKVRKYLEKAVNGESFHHQMLMLIIRPDEPIEVVFAVPKRVRAAIAKLDQYERCEFTDRLAAIETVGTLRRQSWPSGRSISGPAHSAAEGVR